MLQRITFFAFENAYLESNYFSMKNDDGSEGQPVGYTW